MPIPKLSVSKLIGPPKTPGERLQRLFKAHDELQRTYGECYRNVKGMLDVIRANNAGSADDPAIMNSITTENLENEILALRKNTVLSFKRAIKLVELAINELAPGTFDHEDEPLQSDDRDCSDLADDYTAMATAGAAIAAAAAIIPGGQGVAAFSLGFTAGMAIAAAVAEVACG